MCCVLCVVGVVCELGAAPCVLVVVCCYSWIVVRCGVIGVSCSLFVVRRLSFVVCSLLIVGCRVLCVVDGCCVLSVAVSFCRYVVSLCVVCCLLFVVRC